MKKRVCYLVIVAFGLAASVAACTEGSGESRKTAEGRIIHPIDDKLPHGEVEPVVVHKKSACADARKSTYGERIRRYIDGESATEKLNIDVSGHEGVEIRSLDENTLAVLDTREQGLWQYDLQENRAVKVAGRGTGPGELNFPADVVTRGDTVYVANADMRISRVFCDGQTLYHPVACGTWAGGAPLPWGFG